MCGITVVKADRRKELYFAIVLLNVLNVSYYRHLRLKQEVWPEEFSPAHPLCISAASQPEFQARSCGPCGVDISVLGGISASAMGLAHRDTGKPWSSTITVLAKAVERGAFKNDEKMEGEEQTSTLWCQASLDTCGYVGKRLLPKHPDCRKNKGIVNTGTGYHKVGLTVWTPQTGSRRQISNSVKILRENNGNLISQLL